MDSTTGLQSEQALGVLEEMTKNFPGKWESERREEERELKETEFLHVFVVVFLVLDSFAVIVYHSLYSKTEESLQYK
ncbi:Vps35 Endosomal Protein Sorting Factor-Like [Manis pentadactyla]|nr:Vps35 Endosomal Protein Sorting Factor-Like [Manis pentadactyla]